jgi:hypothetical protein
MDDALSGGSLGPCRECGRPLPDGTERYCVHCGAEVEARADDGWQAEPVLVPRGRPDSWSSGDFRAPAPTDAAEPIDPVVVPAWYRSLLQAEAAPDGAPVTVGPDRSTGGLPTLPAPVHPLPVPVEPQPQLPQQQQQPEPTRPIQTQQPPRPAPPAPVTDPSALPLPPWPPRAPIALAPEYPRESGQPPVWPRPSYPAAAIEPAVQLGSSTAGPGAELDTDVRPAPQPAAPQLTARQPPLPPRPAVPTRPGAILPAVMVAALVLVVIAGGTLVWLRSRGSDAVTASAPAGASAAPASVPGGPSQASGSTSGSAADAAPSASPGDPASGSAPVSPSGTAMTATQAARALDDLLDRSTQARSSVSSTAVGLQSCRITPAKAASTFRAAGQLRAELGQQASALNVTALTGGDQAVQAFVAMQRASQQADDAFAAWADEVGTSGCRGQAPHTHNWELGNQYSADASAAKARFVQVWNPIAQANGLNTRSVDGI